MAGGFACIAGVTGVLVVIIVSSVLLGISFYVVEPNHVAMDLNKITMTLDEKTLLQSGRKFLGVGHELIVFPTSQSNIDLGSSVGRTKGEL